MKNYYCPYCNPKYQYQKKSNKGELICGLCGEVLVKKPLIKINQIVAIIASLSLILPMIYTLTFLIRNQINPQKRNYNADINLFLSLSKHKNDQPLQRDLLKQE